MSGVTDYIEKNYKVYNPHTGLVPFELYEHQKQMLASFETNRFNVVDKARQLGVSTVLMMYAAYYASENNDKQVVICAINDSCSNALRLIYGDIHGKTLYGIHHDGMCKKEVHYKNGSVVNFVTPPQCGGCMKAVDLLIIDEAAYIEDAEGLWLAFRTTLEPDRKCILASTSCKTDKWFRETVEHARNGSSSFKLTTLDWNCVPGRDLAWLEWHRKMLSKEEFCHEYLHGICE